MNKKSLIYAGVLIAGMWTSHYIGKSQGKDEERNRIRKDVASLFSISDTLDREAPHFVIRTTDIQANTYSVDPYGHILGITTLIPKNTLLNTINDDKTDQRLYAGQMKQEEIPDHIYRILGVTKPDTTKDNSRMK